MFRVGTVRTSIRDLPKAEHVYGYNPPLDDEGVGEILSHWVTTKPSQHKETGKKIIPSNILALKHGCITAKSMRQYQIDHPNIRHKDSPADVSGRANNSLEGPFGIKTKFAEDSMNAIIEGSLTL